MPKLCFRESKHGGVFVATWAFQPLVPIRHYPCSFPHLELVLDYRRGSFPPFALSPLHERLSFEVWYVVLFSILSSSLLSV
jgi:hypothetical protein